MRLHYYPETDSLYIELKGIPGTETREIVEGLTSTSTRTAMSSASILTTHQASSIFPGSKRLRFRRRAPPSERGRGSRYRVVNDPLIIELIRKSRPDHIALAMAQSIYSTMAQWPVQDARAE